MLRIGRIVLVIAIAASFGGCALAMRSPKIGELRSNPARYFDRTVNVEGVVTSSWGVPLLPYRLYRIDDGTGELTVVAQDGRIPTKGARVKVKGRVNELGTFGGSALGLHLRQEKLDVKRGYATR